MKGQSKQCGLLWGAWFLFVGLLFLFLLEGTSVRSFIVQHNIALEKTTIVVHPFLPHISFLDLCGSVLCCAFYRRRQDSRERWWKVLLSCTMLQFGGTTITALMLGQPPSWLVSQKAFPALFVAWWITFCCPYDFYWDYVVKHCATLHALFFGVFASISSGHASTSWGMDKVLFNSFHVNGAALGQSVLLCLVCGTASASGGGLMDDIFGLSGPPPQHIRTANISKGLLLAILYYFLLTCAGFSLDAAKTLIGMINVFHFSVKLIDPDIDYFTAICDMMRRFCGISPFL